MALQKIILPPSDLNLPSFCLLTQKHLDGTNYFQLRILYSAKILVKCEGRIKTFLDIWDLKNSLIPHFLAGYLKVHIQRMREQHWLGGLLVAESSHVPQGCRFDPQGTYLGHRFDPRTCTGGN